MKGYLTQTDLINLKIDIDKANIDSKRIMHLISSFKNSREYTWALVSDRYFNYQHDVLFKKRYYYLQGMKKEDTSRPNNKIIHNFFNLLVEQKTDYIVGNPITVSYTGELNTEEITKRLDDLLGWRFDDIIKKLITYTSIHGKAFLHPYIDEKGIFRFEVIPFTECIPIYDTDYQTELVAAIRFYEIDYIDENNYNTEKRLVVEWWTANNISRYEQISQNQFTLVSIEPHFKEFNPATNVEKEYSWGLVPFIEVKNNPFGKPDLTEDLKTLIDAYNDVKSDWKNDLEELQELIFVLKGYMGFGGAGIDKLGTLLKNIREQKIIPVDENGGVEVIKNEIPIEAKKEFLKLLREEIFYLGKGLDITHDKFTSAPSGVALKFLYSMLDMKANRLLNSLQKSLAQFSKFIAMYLLLTERIEINYEDIKYTFNKSLIFNTSEVIDNLVKSDGLISKETILENHPYVSDIAIEKQRLKNEMENELEQSKRILEINNNEQSE